MSNVDDADQPIDFSVLPYDEWIESIFNQSINFNKVGIEVEAVFDPAKPIVLVEHLTRMCSEFSTLRTRFSWEQIDQGVWSVLRYPVETISRLMKHTTPRDLRIKCINSMYEVFSGTVAKMEENRPMETCFFMWWDIVSKDFCRGNNHWTEEVFVPEKEEVRKLHDAIFATLLRILNLDDVRCQSAALHGLGHLHHPKGAEVVQKFIDTHRGESTDEELSWAYQCRDGTVM